MKINGRVITGSNFKYFVLPRRTEDGEEFNIVFKIKSITNLEEFEKLCPEPKAPTMIKRNVGLVSDNSDKNYLEAINLRERQRVAFIILNSIRDTEGLEWDTVQYTDPSTWLNYEEDLKKAGFNQVERGRIINEVFEVNSLSDAKIEEARNRFLASLTAQQQQLSQKVEQNGMPSGEPVNV